MATARRMSAKSRWQNAANKQLRPDNPMTIETRSQVVTMGAVMHVFLLLQLLILLVVADGAAVAARETPRGRV